MSRYISWTAYVRRKDGEPFEVHELSLISEDAIRVDLSAEEKWEEWKESPLNLSNVHASNVMVTYFDTESMYAPLDIQESIEEFTAKHPEYLFSVYAQCWDEFTAWRINFADGKSEFMDGFLRYEEPKSIRF